MKQNICNFDLNKKSQNEIEDNYEKKSVDSALQSWRKPILQP